MIAVKKYLMLSVAAVVLMTVSGCTVYDKITRPVPWGMETMPEGTPMFQAGWKDGCETGMSAYGNDRYKVVYEFKQDPQLILNDEYYSSWKEAYTYCRWYLINWVRASRK